MTPHFKLETDPKLSCGCGCGMLPQQDFMDKVEVLRVRYGLPMNVTSAARCPAYNAKVSKTGANGPHTSGRAIDIGVNGLEAYLLCRLAFLEGFSGIGVNQKGDGRFVHLDDLGGAVERHRPLIWSY